MKAMILAAGLMLGATGAHAQYYGYGSNSQSHSVQGHYNSNGSYTQPHYRSNPNSTDSDNWSTRGNYNPYTGQAGTRSSRY